MHLVTSHAITVLGHDRPGIIAETTDKLAGLGLNLEDSSMTRLRGHFAMTLICAGSASLGEIEEALAPLSAGGDLTVTVREVSERAAAEAAAGAGSSWVLTVHGGDRPGIVSAIAGVVAGAGGNITDLTTRLAGDLYLVIAEVDLPPGVEVAGVEAALSAEAARLGVGITLRAAEADEL
jgi:glycine cleavage system transcriptional repressor